MQRGTAARAIAAPRSLLSRGATGGSDVEYDRMKKRATNDRAVIRA
jgi:hypothetical protein